MKRLLSISLAIVLALGLSVVPLTTQPVMAQTTIYVDASNITGPWDGTVANPYQNIQDGINAAGWGDTVQVNAGTYYEKITLESRVIVQGQGAAFTTIDGGGSGWVVTANNNGAVAKLDGFTITNGGATGGTFTGGGISIKVWPGISSPTISNNTVINNNGLGIYTTYSSEATITNNVITGNLQGIRTDNSWPIITNNIITDNSEYGIFNETSAPTIANNIISDNGVHGIHNSGCWGSPTIINNTITGNSRSGIRGYHSTLIISNNIIAGNNEYGISEYPAFATIDYNNVWGNSLGEYQGTSAGPNDISRDPLFVNPGAGDYHLQSGSPCIDAGSNSAPSLPTTDFEGDPRIWPSGGVVDMGVDEYYVSLEPLEDLIDNMGLPNGVATSLSAPLGQASALLNDSNPSNDGAVCGKLDAFIAIVDAKEGSGKLTPAQASQLRQAANAIKASLDCP